MKKQIDPNLNKLPNEDENLFSIDGLEGEKVPDSNFQISESEVAVSTHHHHHHHKTEGSNHSHHSDGSHHSGSSSHHHHHHKKKKPLIVRILLVVISIILVIALVFGGTFLYLNKSGKKDLTTVADTNINYEETIEYKGHSYVYDSNKVAFAFLGVDKTDLGLTSDELVGDSGQADADVVIVVDTVTGEVSLISVPRDTMVDVDLYSSNGTFVKTKEMQLCLSYAYGDGKEKSCENVLTSISRVLKDVPIEKYFALDLEGIKPLNDAIGGVTLNSLNDFTANGIKKGDEITIKGDFAETYVRTREMHNNINASFERIARQEQYIKAYINKTRSLVTKDFSVVSSLYQTASDYSTTNISLNNATYLASLLLSKNVSNYTQYSIKGEMKPSSTTDPSIYAEFYPDDDSVMDIIVNCFYTQIS